MINNIFMEKYLKQKYKGKVYVTLKNNIPIGFTLNRENVWNKFNGLFIERYIAESNASFLQLIPYIIIKNNDDYLITKNTSYELGYSFHIQNENILNDVLYQSILSYLNRTFNFNNRYIINHFGYVRLLKGKHLFICFTIDIDKDSIHLLDTEITAGWVNKQYLYDNSMKFSQTSKYIIDFFYSKEKYNI